MGTDAKLPRILLVDDHRDSVEITAFLLTRHGYEVVSAYSMAGARAAAATQQCEVLVSDIGLPDGSGIALMRELQTQYGMKGVLVSGVPSDGSAVGAEGFMFLPKPLTLQCLLDALQSLWGIQKSLNQEYGPEKPS